MAEISSPGTLEAFAESRVKALLETGLTTIPDENILTGHTRDEYAAVQEPTVTVTVTRETEDIEGTGWWVCTIEAELDPRDFTDAQIDACWAEIHSTLGDGSGDIETQLTNGRLACMTGSAFYDQPHEYDGGEERFRVYRMTASLGLYAP